ncbi:MAG: hypothetical protein H7067_17065 [Burkholderiales bacterium]|nr:hypothetical protein [Opitutaceae bacterium]
MYNSYLLYFAGVILLTLPTGLFTRKRFKLATLPELFDRPRHRYGWLHPLNALDFARAYGGMTLLLAAFTAIAPSAPGQFVARIVLAVAALVGLLMQHAFHKSGDDELPAPLAFTIGLTFGILPPHIALLALPLGIVTAIALRNLSIGLMLTAVATAFLGKLFGQSLITVGTASMLLFVPVILANLLHRRLGLTILRGAKTQEAPLRDVPAVSPR